MYETFRTPYCIYRRLEKSIYLSQNNISNFRILFYFFIALRFIQLLYTVQFRTVIVFYFFEYDDLFDVYRIILARVLESTRRVNYMNSLKIFRVNFIWKKKELQRVKRIAVNVKNKCVVRRNMWKLKIDSYTKREWEKNTYV